LTAEQTGRDGDVRASLSMAMDWIAMAHDATGRAGVSGGYDLNHGWLPPYAETSGYTVPTLLRAARVLDRSDLASRAGQVCEWLLEQQAPDGSFPGEMGTDGDPVVFDVGQILLGLLAQWRENRDNRLLLAADRAASWLRREQDDDGAWRRTAFLGYANAYSTRVSWALLEAWQAADSEQHRETAERALRWALAQARPDGWIGRMSFDRDQAPSTHTIGYTLRGLLRSADILGGALGRGCEAAAAIAAVRLAELRTPLTPLLPGEIVDAFQPAADYACLTGDAQMVTVWLDVARRSGRLALRQRAMETGSRLRLAQITQPIQPEILGALPGSWPLSGGYEPLRFPNWATKFLADALLSTLSA
jgi:Squalene-hopene cyclase C-terminal domain